MTEVVDDLHCSCQRAAQTPRLRPGVRQPQTGSTFFPQEEHDVSQAFISSKSLPPVNCQSTVCKCCLPQCQRTVSTCLSRSALRTNFSLRTTTRVAPSILLHQLRLISFLILLSVSLFHQVDLATARAMGQPQQHEQGQGQDSIIPVRCTLPFSNYDCGSIATVRYTFLNGSCQWSLEWIGGSDCEYDGTENSFASEQECMDVCIPAAILTTTAAPPSEIPMRYPPLGGVEPPTPSPISQSEGSTDADIATTSSSVNEAPTVDTSICFLPIQESCQMITFPTSYFYYNLDSLSCEPRVSFCPMSGPNIFYSQEDCLNACERPLIPTTTTEAPTTTKAPPTMKIPPPLTTTDCPPVTDSEETVTTRTTQPEDDITTTTEKATPTSSKAPSPASTTSDELVTTKPPNSDSSSNSRSGFGPSFIELNKFDLASVGLGMMAFLLIVVLVGVVLLSLYRRHTRLRRQKQEVMDSKKSEVPVRTLAFAVNRHEKPPVQTKHCSNTSMSTTSSTISSYLTTV